MENNQIKPEKITKPIQLLAAWLLGLTIVNGSFLTAAASIHNPEWISIILVIASIVNVPIFLICIFLLQTKFRPEMQEDSYYSKYLELNTGKPISNNPIEASVNQLQNEIVNLQHRQSEIITSIDSSLKALTTIIPTSIQEMTSDHQAKLQAISTQIEYSSKILENEVEPTFNFNAHLEINDLLPEYHKIRYELKKHNIHINKTFGSSSDKPEKPKYKIIGFGADVSLKDLRQVITICQKYGFDSIHYADHIITEGCIYIGSYIYRAPEEPQPVPITPKMLSIINSPDADLYDLIDEIERNRS